MASPGFRKSLMGFNKEDVTNYIEALVKKYKGEETNLLARIENLNIDLKEATERADALQEALNEFEAKREEIEKLSENIGKLYLVSQANADAIIRNAKQSSSIASIEVERNLAGIEETHAKLENLRGEVMDAAKRFNDEFMQLASSLSDTKTALAMLSASSEESSEALDTLMEECAKETVSAK